MIDELWHDYHGTTIESILINCHYPVTPTSFMLQWGVIVKLPPGLSEAQADRVAAKFAKFIGLGFEQDVEIWQHKARMDNPLLCAEDGAVYQLRRWYEQFYTDVEDIAPGHGRALRVRGGHHPCRGRVGGRGRGEPRPAAGASPLTRRDPATKAAGPTSGTPSYRRVECDRCAAAVQVAKFSAQHTSVQWSPASVRACAEFTARAADGEQSALIGTCASLRGPASTARWPRAAWRCPRHDRAAAVTGPRAYHQVPVAEVISETDEACSLVLAVPPELASAFSYRPGQFLTVRVPDGDGRLGGPVLLAVELAAHRGPADDHRQADQPTATPPTGSPTTCGPAACLTCCRPPGRSARNHWRVTSCCSPPAAGSPRSSRSSSRRWRPGAAGSC